MKHDLKKEARKLLEVYGNLTAITGKRVADKWAEGAIGDEEWMRTRKPTPEKYKEIRLRTAADMLKICGRMKTPNLPFIAVLKKVSKEKW